ncbi:MAG: efflux transporter outer membrane subunit [Rubrivivax sp.]|nr:efflux transporter outer membrane subunit [Rubrivivax sp.]
MSPRVMTGAIALGLLALQAGCATPADDAALGSARNALPQAPSAWQAPLPREQGASPADAAWWQRLGDPLLPELIAAARDASPTLSAAASRIERARATRTAASAAMQPRLDAQASTSRARNEPGGPTLASTSVGVQAAWELDLFGGRGAARDAAAARVVAAQAGWHAARVALAAETAQAYLALRACEAQLGQARLDAESREQTSRLSELSARAGTLAPAAAALARASAAQGRAQAAQQQAACESQIKALVSLTAIDEPELRRRLATTTARQPAAPGLAVSALPAELLGRRPDLVAAAQQLQAAAADRRATAALRRPTVTFSGSLGGLRLGGDVERVQGSVWSIGPLSVSIPLLDGGRLAAEEAAARAAYDDAVVQLQAGVRDAVREVEQALVALDSTATREADARAAVDGYEASLRAADARFRGGLANLFELEDARRSAAAARSALIELQRERAAAWVSLYRALGGGFDGADLQLRGGFDGADLQLRGGFDAADLQPVAATR